jgi:hypothetical protein
MRCSTAVVLRSCLVVGVLAAGGLAGCASPAAIQAARSPVDASRSVWLHIESTGPVRLDNVVNNEWVAICTSPCDQPISPDGDFRLAGPGVVESAPFQIHASPGERVDLHVDPSSRFVRGLGVTIVIVGPVVGIGALIVAGVQEIEVMTTDLANGLFKPSCTGGAHCPAPATATSPRSALATAGGAGLLTIVGVVLLVASGRTSVNGQELEGVKDSADSHPSPMLDEPQAPPTTSLGGPTLMVPLLTGTF